MAVGTVEAVRVVLALTLLLLAGLPALPAAAQEPVTDVIVRFAPSADAQERGAARSQADVRRAAELPLAQTELVDPEPGVGVGEAVAALERDPDVLYAEPNWPRRAAAVPDDRFFGLQWGLRSTGQEVNGSPGLSGVDIDAASAWDTTVGNRAVVVAVIDSGTAVEHPDLAANVRRNPGESGTGEAANGRDDDDNGLADDVTGWDFVEGDAVPQDGDGHGTHVAGTIGAVGANAEGVTGVAQLASLLPVRALDDVGAGSVADVVTAYAYAARSGARVANLSYGGEGRSRAEFDALRAAGSVLFVAASGNGGEDGAGDDVDATPIYPCNHALVNVICVAASNRADELAAFSNFGATTVDVAAPGVDIASTVPGTESRPARYEYASGTSMAAPHVSGVAALALARAPGLTTAQLRAVVLGSAQGVPALQCKVLTGARVDAAEAVRAAGVVAAGGAAPSVGTTCPANAPADAAPGPTDSPTTPVPSPPAPEAPSGVGDRMAPELLLTSAATRRAAALRTSGLRVRVGCSEACSLTVTLTLDTATARRLGVRSRRVATVRTTFAAEGTKLVTLRATAVARRALLRRAARLGRSSRFVVRSAGRDGAGNAQAVSRTVTLRR